MMKILSLGLGVQSTAIYYMSSMGILPRLDCAIFADPGREKTKTYQYYNFLEEWARKNNGIPIYLVSEKNLFKDLLNKENSTSNRFSSVPAFTASEENSGTGMLRRQCTGEYKIAQVDNKIRELYGLSKGGRRPKTEVYKGITFDEISRMSSPDEAWKILVYPFCGYKTWNKGGSARIDTDIMNRTDIIAWYHAHKLPVPPKSSCVFCPYQSEHSWADLKFNEPGDFEAACRVDDAIRDSSKQGYLHPVYLHESLKPLREVQFDLTKPDLFSGECTGEECVNNI